MNKKILISAAIFGLISVLLGAFAAHGLEKVIDREAIDSFQVGVRYQMYHALLLLFIGSTRYISQKTKRILLYVILAGIILFSGSIYGLATNDLSGFDFVKIAILTPIGGLLLIISWIIMLMSFLKIKEDKL